MKLSKDFRRVLLFSSFTLGLLLVLTQAALAGYFEGLSAEEQDLVRKGAQVVKFQSVAGDPWPQYTVYQKVNATPFESTAVFYDFDRHHEYFPGIVESRVSDVLGGGHLTVNYKVKLMGQSDETVVRESVQKMGNGYRVEWKLASSRMADQSDGFAVFESLGNAGESTLIVYSTLIVPKTSVPSFLLSMFKKTVENEIRDSVTALSGRIRTLKADSNTSSDPTRAGLLTQEENQLSRFMATQ
jgi:hypothetical protein